MSGFCRPAALLAAVLLTGAGAANAAPNAQYGDDFRPMDARSCTGKTMDELQARNFIEGTNDGGLAWGYNEQSVVLVRCVPMNNGVEIEVLAISRSAAEAERLRNEIRIRVFDERRPAPGVLQVGHFNTDSGAFGPITRARSQPPTQWGFDHRSKSLVACANDAKSAMQSNRLAISTGGDSVVWGQSNDAVVMVKCLPIQGGVDILVVAASESAATAERLRNDIRIVTFRP